MTGATFGFVYGDRIAGDAQARIAQSLLATSAVVFGVMGAWIAIVYPEAMRNILRASRTDHREQAGIVHRLLAPMILSTVVLSTIVVAQPLGPLAIALVADAKWHALVHRVSFAGLMVLTLLQAYALALTLVPLGLASAIASEESEIKETRNKILGSNPADDGEHEEKP